MNHFKKFCKYVNTLSISAFIWVMYSLPALADESNSNNIPTVSYDGISTRFVTFCKSLDKVLWAAWVLVASYAVISYLAAATNPEAKSDSKNVIRKVFITGCILAGINLIAGIAIGISNYLGGSSTSTSMIGILRTFVC